MPRFASSHPEHQVYEDGVTLITVANSGGTIGTAGAAFEIPDCQALLAIYETSVLEAAVGDSLNVYIQTYIGGDWFPVWRFAELLGNDLVDAQIQIAKLQVPAAQGMLEYTAAIPAGTQRHFFGTQWRVFYVVAGLTPDFSFTVKLQPMGTRYGPLRRSPNRA